MSEIWGKANEFLGYKGFFPCCFIPWGLTVSQVLS
jgi:hypothetical protein